MLRFVVDHVHNASGWMLRTNSKWGRQKQDSHIKFALVAEGIEDNKHDLIMGNAITKPWELVSIPFEVEYPGDRRWNRDGAQFRFIPSIEGGPHPTWDKIFDHCGQGLNEAVKHDVWCRQNGVTTGSEYLRCWAASLFQDVYAPLPYLFFYGDQNTGKTTFYESLAKLMTKGYMKASDALTSESNFNGELSNTILAAVEETDLNSNKTAYNKIKDWVTAQEISLHAKNVTPYMVRNTTHWIQCANSPKNCPVFPGDTRITMVHIGPIDPINMIPRKVFDVLLEKEAPNMLHTLLKLQLPTTNDRLNIPALSTQDKTQLQNNNMTTAELFVKERCYPCAGGRVPMPEVYQEFEAWLDPNERHQWTKIKFKKECGLAVGRSTKHNNLHCAINISMTKECYPSQLLTVIDDAIREVVE